jgi:hypothetical protein
MHRSELQRERQRASADQADIAYVVSNLQRKQSELGRAKTSSRQSSLRSEIERLSKKHATLEKSLSGHQKKIAELEAKIRREQQREDEQTARRQKKDAEEQERSRRDLERGLVSASANVDELRSRVSGLEDALLDRVRDAIVADPVAREHDVFLSHAGPDKEIAEELYAELTARGVDVWFDGAELRLGEPLTRQIDRGIGSSRIGVILITPKFLDGRYWTERETGALTVTRRRIIPVLDGVGFEDLSRYSPLLADLVGLTTETDGLDGIAERITAALAESNAEA